MSHRRSKKHVKPRTDEMTLGQPGVRLVGQSAFLKDSGGGACAGCGKRWDTLFPDGTGPCCHKVGGDNDGGGTGPATVKRSN